MYIIRDLRMKNIEIFRVRKDFFGNLIGCLAIVDFRRPRSLDDFLYLKEIKNEKEFGKQNPFLNFYLKINNLLIKRVCR
ncbi:hypothetical protein FDG09_00920 [Clostridium sporogenes]|uniref:hypothetical protein n=1 Tax=Clostridium sporogenes TaxID=1509 RepID=UPI0013D3E71C|nr:hypothetical protein [Clostridium sporogenes]NFV11526.1 hypothetical protein [Clostridium sporogenes]